MFERLHPILPFASNLAFRPSPAAATKTVTQLLIIFDAPSLPGSTCPGGDGNGEFQEAEGTGLGEGEGIKDISDKLDNEDQLLGAEQADKEKPDQQVWGNRLHWSSTSLEFDRTL